MPQAITYTAARQNLAQTMNQVCDSHDAVIITRQGGEAVVMMPLSDYNAIMETSYLLSNPSNAQNLREAIFAVRQGRLEAHALIEEER